jgi:homoserine O-succinyltransferase/O-acetyltransferase
MTLLFDKHRSITSPALVPGQSESNGQITLAIGLVNNMPDGALKATERQFARLLLEGAAPNVSIDFHCFSLPSIARSHAARMHVAQEHRDIAELRHVTLDGLIVTGAEPIATDLPNERYWPEMTALIDWAKTNTRSTIWSCLAAHAAVLHLDGITRQRLPAKCSGVYDCLKVGNDWLTQGMQSPLQVSHSRLNALDEDRLVGNGYQMLTRSNEIGVDSFTRAMPSRFVFFQGHPEYDALSLQREYMRDIARFLSGQRDDYPNIPASYFDADTEQVLTSFEARAKTSRDPTLAAELPGLTLRPGLSTGVTAKLLFKNWVGFLANSHARDR